MAQTKPTGIRYLRTVTVYVSDQAKSEEFYTKLIGFELRAKTPFAGNAQWIEVSPAGGETRIALLPRQFLKQGESPTTRALIFHCEDTKAVHGALIAKGVKFTQEPTKMPWGPTFAIFLDPDGNEIGLSDQR
jgi:lactoylglutathione lyase